MEVTKTCPKFTLIQGGLANVSTSTTSSRSWPTGRCIGRDLDFIILILVILIILVMMKKKG